MIKTIILDNNALFIENYKNIDYFDETIIRICCKQLIIVITGENLLLDSLGNLNLKISGSISNIEYIKL
ncbi:MAG: hypothetical protein E7263_00465 [Lachnospiraceae bacterium]|nr:hypothetical protein [Lachnospiraceae bacterium]